MISVLAARPRSPNKESGGEPQPSPGSYRTASRRSSSFTDCSVGYSPPQPAQLQSSQTQVEQSHGQQVQPSAIWIVFAASPLVSSRVEAETASMILRMIRFPLET